MNIGFVVTHISHGSPGSFVRIHEISKHLSKLGLKATILTPFAEDINNITDVDVRLIPNTMSKLGLSSLGYNIARRMARSTVASSFFLSDLSINRMVENLRSGLRSIVREKQFDILHAVQPIAGLACAQIAREFNLPLATDLHNIWPEEAVSQSLVERDDRTFNRLRSIEQSILDSSDVITVVSDFMKSYMLQNYNVSNKSIIVVPPGGPIIDIPSENLRERNVVYAGMVNKREHVDLFAQSVPRIKEPASFFISNYGDAIAHVKKITAQPGYPHINYFWFVRRNGILEFLINSKIGILTSINDITRQIGPPLKLFDYMACGLPMVANDVGGWSEMIEKEQIGLITRDDPADFAQAVDKLLSDTSLWYRMHDNAINLVSTKYNWKIITQNVLIPMYRRLTNN